MTQTRVNRLIRTLHTIENIILCILLTGLVSLAFVQIAGRFILKTGFFWADPVIYHLVLWVSLIGAAIATRERSHLNIDVINRFLSPEHQNLVQFIVNVFSAGICGILAWSSCVFLRDEFQMGSKIIGSVPLWSFQIILPIAFAVILVRFTVIAGQYLGLLVHSRDKRS